jgi:hypothetical protein
MRSYLINKNLCFYYWLRRGIGKKEALRVAGTIERIVLLFGREALPRSNLHSEMVETLFFN